MRTNAFNAFHDRKCVIGRSWLRAYLVLIVLCLLLSSCMSTYPHSIVFTPHYAKVAGPAMVTTRHLGWACRHSLFWVFNWGNASIQEAHDQMIRRAARKDVGELVIVIVDERIFSFPIFAYTHSCTFVSGEFFPGASNGSVGIHEAPRTTPTFIVAKTISEKETSEKPSASLPRYSSDSSSTSPRELRPHESVTLVKSIPVSTVIETLTPLVGLKVTVRLRDGRVYEGEVAGLREEVMLLRTGVGVTRRLKAEEIGEVTRVE